MVMRIFGVDLRGGFGSFLRTTNFTTRKPQEPLCKPLTSRAPTLPRTLRPRVAYYDLGIPFVGAVWNGFSITYDPRQWEHLGLGGRILPGRGALLLQRPRHRRLGSLSHALPRARPRLPSRRRDRFTL